MITNYEKYEKKANNLIKKLQDNCTEKTICENYGQKKISKFIDKINLEKSFYLDLSYLEQCQIKDICYKVSSMTPIKN